MRSHRTSTNRDIIRKIGFNHSHRIYPIHCIGTPLNIHIGDTTLARIGTMLPTQINILHRWHRAIYKQLRFNTRKRRINQIHFRTQTIVVEHPEIITNRIQLNHISFTMLRIEIIDT